ncbi:hypothetical protein DPMN_102291 [Dreissena polymorpha]|uniref:F-box domain-containing protein n=2 Tax=Dreissena polymorpha TaxID=45954 RepID=A0A9D4LK86_DREPO|nr:hypothetical protein DPMN_102291 [Dreissena polymorpha]
MRCPGMEGIPPMLHCNVCMCLFHNECVNYFGQDSDFVCLRCKDVQDSLGNFNPTVTSSNDSMVMKVNAPMILSQLGATSGDSRPIKMVQANVPLSTTISGIPFHFSNPNVSGMGLLNSSLQSTPATSSPSVALALSMAGLTPVSSSSVCPIQPAASIKQEPFDNYDTDGVQASSDALKGLKAALLNKINSPDHPVMTVSGQDKMFKTISPRPTSFTSGNTNINPAYPLLSTMPRIPVVNTTRFMTYGAPRMPVVNSLYQPLQNPGPPLPGLVSMNSANKSQQPLQTVPSLLGPTSIVPVTTSHGLAVGETPSSGPVVVNAKHVAPMNGQLLTLPHAVVKRLNLNKALSLKINNKQIYVPPSAFFQSNGGLKVFLPLNTFPAADDQKMDLSVSNEKSTDDSLANGPSEKLESVKRARASDIRKSKYYSKFCMIKALYGGYDVMTVIFRYLQLKDLLRCSEVCRTWRLISMSPNLWRRVSFKGCRISDMQKALQYIGSRLAQRINLDGLGHVGDEANRTWHQLLVSLQHVPTLRHITFGVIPSTPLQSMCSRLVNVEGFCAEKIVESNDDWVSPTKLDISKFSCMTGLRELRLSGLGGLTLPSFSFSGGLADLGVLSKLTTLHLTSLREVEGSEFSFISLLSNLSDLALGDCTKWTQETYSHLQKLSSLRCLRLEHGGSIPDTGLGLALSNLMLLEELELYCFTVAYTFGNHISDLISLRRFYILPDNSTFASEVNSNTLAAIEKLPNLKELTWAIPEKSSASIILDDNENTEQPEQWIPFHLTMEQKESGQTQYLNMSELLAKLKLVQKNTEVNVIIHKEKKA